MSAPDRVELHRLDGGDWEVELLPGIGGRLHRVRYRGTDLLRTPSDPAVHLDEPFFWGAFVMVPWCNRIANGELVFEGKRYQLPTNHPDGSAIHGDGATASWDVVSPGVLRRSAIEGVFPWPYEAEQRVEVATAGVSVTVSVTNVGGVPMPAGVGLHPWFVAPVALSLPAALVYEPGLLSAPVAVEGDCDLRSGEPPAWNLDAAWTGLTSDYAALRVASDELELGWSGDADHVMLNSHRPFNAVAIEPQTQAPHGFERLERGLPGAVRVLAPGESLTVTVTLRQRTG